MERIAKQNGWYMTWAKDGGLEITHGPSPVVLTHRVTGESVWFNQAHLLHKSVAPWTSAWLGPAPSQRLKARMLQPFIKNRFFYHSTHADGSGISLSDLACIRRAVADEMVLLIDNKLVAHGRQPYVPPRTIFAALFADTPRKKRASGLTERVPAVNSNSN